MCDKVEVSQIVRDFIRAWAPSVSRYEIPSQKLYRSPNNRYEAWSARIPNPNSNKGKSGGYRLVFFLDIQTTAINLDFIEERDRLGYKNEGHKNKDRCNEYIDGLKDMLKKADN
jgi:mRNA-degrading endonuclease RelE of RelBE toxin-antitoxin system